MFKHLIIYRICSLWEGDFAPIEQALAKTPFMECGATQEKSCGWVPPRGEAHGAMLESIGGQWIARFMTEAKVLPGSVLARKVKEKADRIEQETGRKPGKKESRELKDEAKLDLLPMAFTKQASMWVWIDPAARLLVLDTASQGRADAMHSGFDAADMATASAQGFRDGVASIAASAPEGMVGGWMPIETAPKNGRTLLLGYFNSAGKWRTTRGQWMSQDYIDEYAEDPDFMSPGWHETTVEDDDGKCWPINPTHWMPIPPPPTSSADSRKGE